MNLTTAQIKDLQFFLIGLQLYTGKVDGGYGPMTRDAVKLFQAKNGLTADGIAGAKTIQKAVLMGLWRAEYPMKPTNIKPLSTSERIKLFGKIYFEAAHDLRDKDAIIIKGTWEKDNMVWVEVPQLTPIRGTSKILCHKLVAHQFVGLFKELEEKNLLSLILTWDGLFYPRFIRGYYGVLSTHSWGVAFDINIDWNKLGATPALIGEKGSVRLLVEIALKWGFYWGGWFSRKDGQHFEIYKILPK